MFNLMKKAVTVTMLALLVAGAAFAQERFARGGKYRVEAQQKDLFAVKFNAGQEAAIYVKGDGDTDLDLYIFDENANLMGKDEDDTDECLVRFHPRESGKFVVVVVNRGRVYNDYLLAIS